MCNLRYFTGNCLDRLRKIMKNCQNTQSLGQDLKPGPLEYQPELLITLPRRSVRNQLISRIDQHEFTIQELFCVYPLIYFVLTISFHMRTSRNEQITVISKQRVRAENLLSRCIDFQSNRSSHLVILYYNIHYIIVTALFCNLFVYYSLFPATHGNFLIGLWTVKFPRK